MIGDDHFMKRDQEADGQSAPASTQAIIASAQRVLHVLWLQSDIQRVEKKRKVIIDNKKESMNGVLVAKNIKDKNEKQKDKRKLNQNFRHNKEGSVSHQKRVAYTRRKFKGTAISTEVHQGWKQSRCGHRR